jgi:dihydrofolate synthase/folylpolyglutamate synthase
MVKLDTFLDRKPLYYKEIDHERVHAAYNALKPHIKHPTTIHVVGTNGKGSTGRMMAHLAWQGGRSVGHFSSPHILRFNERIWIDGADASDAVLETAHRRLFRILGKGTSDALSYFEYTTLLALVVFEDCDLIVLEAGLGGEYDATNVCDKELSVFTPIGIDHQAFLGETIEEIAATKLRSMQQYALLAPQPYPEVEAVAKEIATNKEAELRICKPGVGAPLVGALERYDSKRLEELARTKGWPDFLVQNARAAMAALTWLDIPFDVATLRDMELFGRFYLLHENIRIDVGHNPLAARAIVDALEPNTVLIYNALDDKDYEAVLRILAPKLKRVEIIPIETERATDIRKLEVAIAEAGLSYRTFKNALSPNEHYLVFGSFYVVETFLETLEIKK